MLEEWNKLEKIHFKEIKKYLESTKSLSEEFCRENQFSILGFNVFKIVSDTYYKENFHSYLICNLLSQSYHIEGNLFTIEFIKCLNKLSRNKIDINDFLNSTAEREKSNIDIRIRDKTSMKSIIIENKINNAVDQPNQIPRYFENEINENFEVVSVVYLTLTEGKKPNKKLWETDYKTDIDKVLIYLSASTNEKVNLLSDWIDRCVVVSNQLDVISTLRQYKAIIQHLREKEMNQELLQKFYTQIMKDTNYSTALSIRSMLSELNKFRALRLKKQFQHQATGIFKKINDFEWGKEFRAKFESPTFDNIDFWIDIVCVENETKVYFHESTTFDESVDKIKILLERLGEVENFKQALNCSYLRVFRFPEEEENLIFFLGDVFTKLNGMTKIKFKKNSTQ